MFSMMNLQQDLTISNIRATPVMNLLHNSGIPTVIVHFPNLYDPYMGAEQYPKLCSKTVPRPSVLFLKSSLFTSSCTNLKEKFATTRTKSNEKYPIKRYFAHRGIF